MDNLKSSSSEESMRHRASSSNDSILSESSASAHNSPLLQGGSILWTDVQPTEQIVEQNSITTTQTQTLLSAKSREVLETSV